MTLADMKREAAKHGATVEESPEGRWKRFNCVAPDGKQWAASGTHCLVVEWEPAQKIKGWKEEEIRDAIERMSDGLADCPEDCDCREEQP